MKIPDFVISYLPEPSELYQVTDHIFGLGNNIEELAKSENVDRRKLIIISGLSGSGKDTIADKLTSRQDNYKRVRTCTTRLKREEEMSQDDPYIRISSDQLHEMLIDGTALECVEYAGNYYCTSKFEIQRIVDEGRTPILRVDPQGAKFFLNASRDGHVFLKNFDFLYFFIVPTSFQDLRERLVARNSSPQLIEERIVQSKKDITLIGSSHYIVVNEFGLLEEVVDEILKIIDLQK